MKTSKSSKIFIFLAFALNTVNVFTAIGSLNIILPILTEEFGVTTGQISLIPLAYATMISALTLPFGRLGDRLGHYKVYLIGSGLYTFSCLLNALFSHSFLTLLVFRLSMGVGAAMVQAVSQVLLIRTIGADNRGLAVGVNSSLVAFSNVISPTLAGIIAESVGWRYIFWLNVPIGLLGVMLGRHFLKNEKGSSAKGDGMGTACFMGFLVTFLLFFNSNSIPGLTGSLRYILIAASIALGVLFLVREHYAPSPLIQLNFFRSPPFAGLMLILLLQYSTSYALSTSLPFYLSNVQQVSTVFSGLICLSFPIMMAMFGTTFGTLSDKIGSFPLILGGLVIELGALFLIRTYSTETSIFFVVFSQLLFGFGAAVLSSPSFNVLMRSVPEEYSGVASGLQATARSLGTAVGTSVFGFATAQFSPAYEKTGADSSAVFVLVERDMVAGLIAAIAAAILISLTIRWLTHGGRRMSKSSAPVN